MRIAFYIKRQSQENAIKILERIQLVNILLRKIKYMLNLLKQWALF